MRDPRDAAKKNRLTAKLGMLSGFSSFTKPPTLDEYGTALTTHLTIGPVVSRSLAI